MKLNPKTKEYEYTEIDKLERAKSAALEAWRKLSDPADAAWKKYEAAKEAHADAVLYEKAKRKVMRDLINAAGESKD